jgi:hypothetical protein
MRPGVRRASSIRFWRSDQAHDDAQQQQKGSEQDQVIGELHDGSRRGRMRREKGYICGLADATTQTVIADLRADASPGLAQALLFRRVIEQGWET